MIAKLLKKIGWGLIGIISMGVLGAEPVQGSELNFAVLPTLPENQIDKGQSYFHLKVAPGSEQELTVVLKNETVASVIVEAGINRATTNSNGVVEYGPTASPKDDSLAYDLRDLAKVPKEIELAPHSSKSVTIKVSAPEKSFDGVIAGGITFKEKMPIEESTTDTDKGLSIQNEYAYVVALLLEGESKEIIPQMNLLSVEPGQTNERNVIKATLQNDQPAYVNQVATEIAVTKSDNSKVMYQLTRQGMQVAPNSQFALDVPLNGDKLEPGKYELAATIYGEKNENGKYQSADGTHYRYRWKLAGGFTVDPDQASYLNKRDVSIESHSLVNWLWLILLLFLLLLVYGYYRKKRQRVKKTERLVK